MGQMRPISGEQEQESSYRWEEEAGSLTMQGHTGSLKGLGFIYSLSWVSQACIPLLFYYL